MAELSIAIGDLASFCHRSGDIDHRFKPSPTGEQGIAGHQRIYQRRPVSYQKEYAVEYRHIADSINLTLRGRADGYDNEAGLLEEIKTCRVAPESIPDNVAQLHFAQGFLYAAIIANTQNKPHLDVRVTWLNIDTDEEFSRTQRQTRAELDAFLASTLSRFSNWLRTLDSLQQVRNTSLASLTFPHGEFRNGQREIAELAYKCIDQSGQLVIEAPTGIGKTAALLFPALKALGTRKHDKVIFTTAKNVGRRAAEDTLEHFANAGYKGTALSLTAKDKICLSPGHACHSDDCPYAAQYYDKLPEAMDAAINLPSLRRSEIEAIAQRFAVCPYELSLDLLPWVDVIIADLHYVYSLTATLGSAIEQDDKRWTVLVDEAHNLPGRAREMYSAELTKAALMEAKKGTSGAAKRELSRINKQILALQKTEWSEADFHSTDELPTAFVRTLEGFTAFVGEQLAQDARYLHQRPSLMDFYFNVLQFLRVIEHWEQEYRFEMTRDSGKQSLRLKLNCLEPARLLRQRQKKAHAVTVFSATLSPLPWSRTSLGLEDGAVCHRASSPFTRDQLKVTLATHVDTRYAQREKSLPELANTLQSWLSTTTGNCIVYFPSYAYMEQLLERLNTKVAGTRTFWQQRRDSGESGQQTLLALLEERRDVAAFCILGGIFGEGIDLPGEQLSSVVIVGVGMPQVNRETRALQKWYEQGDSSSFGTGFDHAFVYPGMQKVDQALGRVVRTMDDRGTALLIDSRYGERRYRDLLPDWWQYTPWSES